MTSGPEAARPLYLRPWHAFTHGGHEYVVNLVRMIARRVPDGFTVTLERIAADPCAARAREDELELFRLKLVSPEPVTDTAVKKPMEDGAVAPPIRSINLFLAQRCNLRCTYCYGGGSEYAEVGMMVEETAVRAVDWLLEQSGRARARRCVVLRRRAPARVPAAQEGHRAPARDRRGRRRERGLRCVHQRLAAPRRGDRLVQGERLPPAGGLRRSAANPGPQPAAGRRRTVLTGVRGERAPRRGGNADMLSLAACGERVASRT